ncbi:DUF885 domain-containing protein [Flavihumibacter sp. R14]|nr:DUF885 domain-containing protein [Flavihumibacter soli]
MRKFTLPVLALLLLTGCFSLRGNKNPGTDLNSVLEGYSREFYALNPLNATANNINTYNDQLAINISEAYVQRSITLNNLYLAKLKRINYRDLSESDRLSADILKYQLSLQNEGLRNHYGFYRPVDQFVFSFPQRFALLGSGAGYVTFKTETDYRNFISRMKLFGVWVDQAIKNMQKGLEIGNTNPAASMAKVPAQLKPLFELDGDKNIFYKPLLALPADLDNAAKEKLTADYTAAINTYVRPAYKRLNHFLETSYIPRTRRSAGLTGNQNGKAEYAYWLKYYTSSDITADEVFELGLAEVARIRKEMDSIKTVAGFKDDLKAFFQFIKTDPKFFPFKTEAEILHRYRSFEARMEPHLETLFQLRPASKFEVRATEKFREAAANAQYLPPSRDGQKPGIFYETVRDPLKYNSFEMETLFLHEAIPGHHYQLAIQQEANIPEFRKKLINSAFAEGWGLYAESLGTSLGMFTDPYQYMGRLSNEMERAVRLVVDAGMHHKGWTREQAIAYVLDNQPVTDQVAEQRIERYMVVPGQGVSYKVGELKIIALRNKAQKALGDKFDIREFHAQVLKDGCLPLLILERQIDKWIESKILPLKQL